MNSIIAENLRTEQTVKLRIDAFFLMIGASKLLKASNFYKESGIPCLNVLKTIFTLIFTERNLYRTLTTNPETVGFSKNTAYRFLNSQTYNWSKFLRMAAENIIKYISAATNEDRTKVLIVDDSLYDRNRSKKVELLARVYDHSIHKFVKGFKMLTVGWSDGYSFIPAAFSLLSSQKDTNVICQSAAKDKRTIAYKRRLQAKSKSTDVLIELLSSIKHLPAKNVLFDSWFGLPKTICKVCGLGFNVICMVKNSSKIHYCYNNEWVPVSKLHKIAVKQGKNKGNITGSIQVSIRESKTSESLIPAKLVFVEARDSKEFLTILSTDVKISDEEILRIYGMRWNIEVFFKMCKSHLALAKEFQGRSYDMLISHTTIVFLRYMMLSVEHRNSNDLRTIGGLFYNICDEVKDINLNEALVLILSILKETLLQQSAISEELFKDILNAFFSSLPTFWSKKFKLCA